MNDKNIQTLKPAFLDPTPLAVKINKILKNVSFASIKNSLYIFLELFLFKYLSDIGILKNKDSFEYIVELYKNHSEKYTNADILVEYNSNARETMKALFIDDENETSIISGELFHVSKNKFNKYVSDDDTDKLFKEIIFEFKDYEEKNGKFINICPDFKSKLFETFMKKSNKKLEIGQFFTPLKIVQEMVAMVDVHEGMTICDPACGVGKFLLETIVKNIDKYYSFQNGKKLDCKVTIIGYDKFVEDERQGNLTIILAKINALIYFAELFQKNSDPESVKQLSQSLLNKNFHLYKSRLGTLGQLEENKYDLILSNPPYYRSKVITSSAKDTNNYNLDGNGVESLFLEWIMKALKPGGVANIILPDGIFSNQKNIKTKKYILDNFFIDSIISLPVNAFFNTPKKTYILNIKKKTSDEIKKGIVQKYPVFCYIANTIGETLDSYRFDIDDNDLKVGVDKYILFKTQRDIFNETTNLKNEFNKDPKLKLIKISNFMVNNSWIIENWWTEKEKIEIGLEKAKKVVTIDEFIQFIEDLKEALKKFEEELKCLK